MASTGVGFRWLDILEKEFDKAYVELDTSLAEIDADDPEVAYAVRQKMAALSSCFAQLSHKAQTIFQNSAKVEAELINLRTELVDARARKDVLEQQYFSRLPPPEQDPEPIGHMSLDMAHLKCESLQLYRENIALRDTVLALHSEVYGARLAAKYLDKELAGRIQQLQLLGREMKGELRDRLWRQLEAEILLQRHKTVVRACRSADGGGASARRGISVAEQAGVSVGEARGAGSRGVGEPRHVRVPRKHHQGLGISITGGREHGVPILISELEADGPAAHTGQLYVGDAILSVNNIDLRQACHKEAVSILQNQTGDCILCVQFVAEDSDDDNSLSEDGYTFQYPVFPSDEGGAGEATPTAPRTPDPPHLHPLNHGHSQDSQQDGLHPRSGSEDYSDYIVTPENNHKISALHSYAHQTAAQNTYFNNNLNISPLRFDDSTYPVRQNSIFGFNNLYDEYHTANNNKVVQHSILDMDDNTIKIETEINSTIIPYDDKLTSHKNEANLICDEIVNVQEMDGCNFINKHVEVVDIVNNGNVILNTSNNSFTNSESASSPMQTSSDNIIISSGISCGNIDLNSADSKSPKSVTDEMNKIENQKNLTYASTNEMKSDDKLLKTTDLLINSPVKNVKHKTARKNSAKMDSDKSMIEVKSHKSNLDSYNKDSEGNQNLGFLYPKLSNIKPFGLNQYHGLLGDLKKGFDESSLSPEDSVETTPVHGKKPQVKVTKKKRVKGGDWKSKGAYQAINNANTSDMDSPVREIKPDKRYHRDSDTHSKFGVKTIQSIFEKASKEEKQESKKLISNLMDEISSEVETNLVLQEQLASLQKLPAKAEPMKKNTVEEKPLMRFTPEHALPNIKPNNSVVLAIKTKPGDSVENGDNSNNEQCFNSKLNADNQCANANFQQNIKLEEMENAIVEMKNLSSQNIQGSDKKILNTKLSVKNRGFRIGSAKRVPPPPDVIHIPLKDFSKNMQETLKAHNTDILNNKLPSNESSNVNPASSKNYAEAEQIFPDALVNQEQIETEINDIYPVIESIIRGTHSSEHSQADIDATLKLALGQLEKSMMNDCYERDSQKSNPSVKPLKQSNYSLPTNKTETEYYNMPNKVKAVSGKRSSISSYPLAKDILIEGNGDPDFGTPV